MKYSEYSKQELIDKINLIGIEKVGGTVVTKWGSRVINITPVSDRYEIFDIVKYIKDKIDIIEKNFEITKYRFRLTKGVQYLELLSESVEIDGLKFQKSFHILNSTDKSRRLSFNSGLFCEKDNFYVISNAKNVSMTKKHLKGVTEAAETASEGLSGETFIEQIESIRSLVGHKILLSKIREIILGDKDKVTQINHNKFDAFKSSLRQARHSGKISLTPLQSISLSCASMYAKEIKPDEDFYIDAFLALQIYLKIFREQDSHTIKNETDRIMKMTQWAVRNNLLESLGI